MFVKFKCDNISVLPLQLAFAAPSDQKKKVNGVLNKRVFIVRMKSVQKICQVQLIYDLS